MAKTQHNHWTKRCDMAHSYARYTFARDMRHSYWNFHTCDHTCGIPLSYVCYNAFVRVTWLIHVSDTPHSYEYNDSVVCAPWLVHMRRISHSHLKKDVCIWGPQLYMWHNYVWYHSMSDTRHHSMCATTLCVPQLSMCATTLYVCHNSMCTTTYSYECNNSMCAATLCVTPLHVCHMWNT